MSEEKFLLINRFLGFYNSHIINQFMHTSITQNAALHNATYSFELSHAGKEKRQSRLNNRMMIYKDTDKFFRPKLDIDE